MNTSKLFTKYLFKATNGKRTAWFEVEHLSLSRAEEAFKRLRPQWTILATCTQSVKLTGYDTVPGLPASEIRLGDVVVFNYGYTATVTGIRQTSECYLTFDLHTEAQRGFPESDSERRVKVGTLVAVTTETWEQHQSLETLPLGK